MIPCPGQPGKESIRRSLFNESWQLAGREFLQLQREGFDPEARNSWAGIPVASSEPAKELFARIDELLIGDSPDLATARDVISNRVRVAAADARRDKHLQFMTPMRMWNARSFHIAKDLTPEQAATPPRRAAAANGSTTELPVQRGRFKDL